MAIDRIIRLEQHIDAAAETVWKRVSDHEGTPSWISEVAQVRMLTPGADAPGGLGAVREVAFKPMLWSTIQERISEHRPGERFHYIQFAGMPGLLAHEGRVSVAPDGTNASTVRWEIDFKFRSLHWFRPLVPSFLAQFEGTLRRGLSELKRQLENRSS